MYDSSAGLVSRFSEKIMGSRASGSKGPKTMGVIIQLMIEVCTDKTMNDTENEKRLVIAVTLDVLLSVLTTLKLNKSC